MPTVSFSFLEKNLHDFLRPFENHVTRPKKRQLLRMIKGMIEGKTVHLTEIGRIFSPGVMPKTICESLGKFLAFLPDLGNVQLQKRNKFVSLIVDETDIEKSFAQKIEGMERTWNGSEHRPGQGYNLLAVVGKGEDSRLTPVILERYEEKNLGRERVIQKYLDAHGPDHGAVWIADRGWDDQKIFDFLLRRHQQFLIRLDAGSSSRHLTVKGPEGAESWSVSVLCRHMGSVGYRRVFLPKRRAMLTLIRYDHGKKEPLYLLTTLSPKNLEEAEKIARDYLSRWDIETYFRFVKQHFALEKIMLQHLDRVDSLLGLVLIASSFLYRYLPTEEDQTALALWYFVWCAKEQADISSASFARFCAERFSEITLVFRRGPGPPDPHQLKLFPA